MTDQLTRLYELLTTQAPDNEAHYPLTITRDARSETWWVSVHVRIGDRADFALDCDSKDLDEAAAFIRRQITDIDKRIRSEAAYDARYGIHR